MCVSGKEIFVPPGICRESHYKPLIPNCCKFTTTDEDLQDIELEGFDDVMKTYRELAEAKDKIEE